MAAEWSPDAHCVYPSLAFCDTTSRASPHPARHAPWLACPWVLSVNSTRPTFLSPPQVGLVELMGSGTGTYTNYRPGVDPTLTVDSRLTAVPPKPSKPVVDARP